MNELFVTFNPANLMTAVVGGFLLGLLAINETVETVLERFIVEVRVHELLRLVPVLLVIIGTPIVVTFWVSALLTDAAIASTNDPWRAAGRGLGHLVFLWLTAFGSWVDVRYRRHP